MKPRTKFQHKVVEASKRLPDLTPAQIRWAFTHVVEPIGRRTSKGEITCLDCGEVFHNMTKQNIASARIAERNSGSRTPANSNSCNTNMRPI